MPVTSHLMIKMILVLTTVNISQTAAAEWTCNEEVQNCPDGENCFGRKMFDGSLEYACSEETLECTGDDGCLGTCVPPYVPCIIATTTSSTAPYLDGITETRSEHDGETWTVESGEVDNEEDQDAGDDIAPTEPSSPSTSLIACVVLFVVLFLKTL